MYKLTKSLDTCVCNNLTAATGQLGVQPLHMHTLVGISGSYNQKMNLELSAILC